MLSVDAVVKVYDTIRAVDGLSFTAKAGEIFGLIGPNGSGKTTTIRMIMNVIAPDQGSIRFDDLPFSETMKSRIGYLPEERGLNKKVKVMDMLVYLAVLKGMKAQDARVSAETWLDRFGLGEWKSKKVETLSKGMAQKVQFIGSVVHDPDLVLFDEPFSGLDPVSQDTLLEVVLDLKRQGKTVILSTHVMEQAERLCDHILLVRKGRELVTGSLSQLKAGFGTNSVQIEFDGDASFISSLPCVGAVRNLPHWIEAELKPGHISDELLTAVAGRLRIRRYQLMEPSLHAIFVHLVEANEPVFTGNLEEAYRA
ncbi:ATP-binding cassette domain-containing protein [Spirochaetota bacterium]